MQAKEEKELYALAEAAIGGNVAAKNIRSQKPNLKMKFNSTKKLSPVCLLVILVVNDIIEHHQ